MNSFTKKAVVALGIAALGFAANAQFAPGQTGTALADQVCSALAASSLADVVQAAIAAGVSPPLWLSNWSLKANRQRLLPPPC